jgi:hypothetical protein
MKILSFDVGIINLAYCIFDTVTCKIQHWEIIELSKKGNTFSAHIARSGIAELYLILINELDKRPHLLENDVTLIEKQPSFNPKMRIIAGCLQTYFYIRGVVDRKENPIKSVEFFSPKHKLKCYTGPELDISRNGKTVKGKYAQTKKMGVLIAQVKLEEYSETPENITFFEKNKKKDDLADSYLQALTYSTFKKLIKSEISENLPIVDKKKNKTTLKKELKEYLDPLVKNCSVTEIMNGDFKSIGQVVPEEHKNNIEDLLTSLNMKKYLKLRYL